MHKQHSKPLKQSDPVPRNLDHSEGVQELQDDWQSQQPPIAERLRMNRAAMDLMDKKKGRPD